MASYPLLPSIIRKNDKEFDHDLAQEMKYVTSKMHFKHFLQKMIFSHFSNICKVYLMGLGKGIEV
jgi:hypothetical protein